MRNLFLIVFIVFFTFQGKPQTGINTSSFPDYTNSISLNIPGLLFKSITLFADHKIRRNNTLELTAGYHFRWNSDNYKILFIPVDDPFWFYTKINAAIGINHYYAKHFYLGTFLQYQYRYFDKIKFKNYIDFTGDMADEDWTISRVKNVAGIYLKLGFPATLGKKFICNFYFDMGINYLNTLEKVWARDGFYQKPIPDNYPIVTRTITYPLGINMGFALGFRK